MTHSTAKENATCPVCGATMERYDHKGAHPSRWQYYGIPRMMDTWYARGWVCRNCNYDIGSGGVGHRPMTDKHEHLQNIVHVNDGERIKILEKKVARLTEALDFFLCRSVEFYKYKRPALDENVHNRILFMNPREAIARDTLKKLGLKRS